MKQRINFQSSVIKVPIIVAVVCIVVAVAALGLVVFKYYRVSAWVKEAAELSRQERYDEALEKLSVAQAGWFAKGLKIKEAEIEEGVRENQQLSQEKSIYLEGSQRFEEEEWQEAIDVLSGLPETSPYYQEARFKIKEAEKEILRQELIKEQVERGIAENIAKIEAEKRIQEEAARKAAEEERAQEEEARKMAEAETKKEEAARKFAEERANQEREAREAQEEQQSEMAADNDNDGLSYREELSKGTSDTNSDSDDDGIMDAEDKNPAGGGVHNVQVFEWRYGGQNWTWKASVHEDWYWYYKSKNQPRTPHGLEYVTPDDQFIQEAASQLRQGADAGGYDIVLLIASFVQGLPYVEDSFTGFDEYPKYPVETFFERNGDCEDISYLAASLMNAATRDSALVELSGHMAIAIKAGSEFDGMYYEIDGERYYYLETTRDGSALGEMPAQYINVEAKITRVRDGEVIYAYPQRQVACNASQDIPGYYYSDGKFYSDEQCANKVLCLPYSGYYYSNNTKKLYHDSACTQLVVADCAPSETHPGYFYKGGYWYSDSTCTRVYKSMACEYPSALEYECISESMYNLKKGTCDFYRSSAYYQDLVEPCEEELSKCRGDIDEYQGRLEEYNQCQTEREY